MALATPVERDSKCVIETSGRRFHGQSQTQVCDFAQAVRGYGAISIQDARSAWQTFLNCCSLERFFG